MHNSLKLHFVYTTRRFPLPSTNTPWYLHRRGRDAGWLAAGQGGTEGVGVQDGTPPPRWPWATVAAAPRVAPSPGLRPKEQAQAQRRKVPVLSTSGSSPGVASSGGHPWGRGVPARFGGRMRGQEGSRAVPAQGQGQL